MTVFGGLATALLTGVVGATLQLSSGALLLLFHASLGKHIKKQTRRLTKSFIFGVGLATFLVLGASGFIIYSIFGQLPSQALLILIGILLALAVVMWILYYRRGSGTELWLPKRVARLIDQRAKETDSPTEACMLGIFTYLAEWPFTLVLAVSTANAILGLSVPVLLAVMLAYVFITILPLILMRYHIKHGKTVVDIQRWRVKNKTFLRVVSGVSFLALAVFLIVFEVLK